MSLFLACKGILKDMKPLKLKDEDDTGPAVTETEYLGTKLQGQGFGASHPQNKWGFHFCCFSCAIPLAAIKRQDSRHPDLATWQIRGPREDHLD